VIKQVQSAAASRSRAPSVSWIERLPHWFGGFPAWKTGLATAAILIVAAVFWYQADLQQPVQPESSYSEAEVEQATREIQLTLAYLQHYMWQTSQMVEHQLASTENMIAEPVHTILLEQLQSTQTVVKQPVQTLVDDAAASFDQKRTFDAMQSFIGGFL
jgi:hypothetical protein